jgi:glucan phosphoethanolaminetransferase (alkaline phosphatase superfamily)
MNAEKKRKLLAASAVIATLSLPIVTGYGLTVFAKSFPHVIRYMQGKYIISLSFILSVVLVFVVTHKVVKSKIMRILVRLPVTVLFIALAFLFTIRSYCDPDWFEEDEEGAVTSTESSSSSACK